MKRFLFLFITVMFSWTEVQAEVKAVSTVHERNLSNQYVDVYSAYVVPNTNNAARDTILIYAPGGRPFDASALGDTVISVQFLANTTSSDSIRFNWRLMVSYKPNPAITATKANHPDWVRIFTSSNNRAVNVEDDSSSFVNNLPFKVRNSLVVSTPSAIPVQFHLQYAEETARNSTRPFYVYVAIPKRNWPAVRSLQ